MPAKKKARKKSVKGKRTATRKPRTPKAESTAAPGVSTEASSKQDGRARYSEEFKRAAVARVLAGEKAIAVGKDLGVSVMSLRQWRKKFGAGAGAAAAASPSPKRRGRPPKRLGRPPKTGGTPKRKASGIAGEMEAKLREIEELKAEIQALARQL